MKGQLRRLRVVLAGAHVGTIAETAAGEIFFEYSPEWLQLGFPISPYHLPLTPGLKQEETRIFEGLFGVFDDSLPDGWGRLLTDRFFRSRGITPEQLSPLERLAYVGRHGMGALEYEPPEGVDGSSAFAVDLAAIADQSERIVNGSPEEALPALRAAGGSSSGSRPKAFVALHPATGEMTSDILNPGPGFEHWLVKFRSKEDPADAGAIEVAYAELAIRSGIDMPATRLFNTPSGDFFGIERFDWKTGGARIHTHTFGGLIHSDFRQPVRDYQEYLRVVFDVTKDFRQVEQAYLRAAFNVFAHNRDDHVKNFAFIRQAEGEWSLSPAYDITFSHGVRGQHNMMVMGNGDPTSKELLGLADDAQISKPKARAMLDAVRASIAEWPKVARRFDLSQKTTGNLARVFSERR